jgi:hypothetical protein
MHEAPATVALPSLGARHRRSRVSPIRGGACPICEGVHDEADRFLAGASSRSARIDAATWEAVVDSLGFCSHHGTALGLHSENAAFARILWKATDRVIELIRDEKRNAERLIELFFVADRSCALCRMREQQVARHIRRLPAPDEMRSSAHWLCFPHYCNVAYARKSPALLALASSELELLACAATQIGTAAGEREAPSPPSLGSASPLDWAQRVVAGRPRLGREAWLERGSAGDCCWDDAFEGPRVDAGCPVWAEVTRAEARWARSVTTVARLGQDLWTAFPTCSVHVGLCAQLGSERLATLVARYAAIVELRAVQRGARWLARDIAQREAAKQSVFYRPQAPAYILGQQRRMITSIPRCPACERLVVARDRAVGTIVQRLQDARRHRWGDVGRDLCLKHFALVYLFAPQGPVRSALAGAQVDKLHRIRDQLSHAVEDSGTVAIDTAVRAAQGVWQTAMRSPSSCP